MHQHVRTGLPELASDEPADPVCRTGDQCRLSAQLFHRRSPHGARRARLLWDAGSSKSSFSETKTIAAGAVGRQKTKGRARLTAVLLKVGPEVRIPLPPGESRVRTSSRRLFWGEVLPGSSHPLRTEFSGVLVRCRFTSVATGTQERERLPLYCG